MITFKPELTLQKLTEEYVDWTRENKMGRDKNGIRFGQNLVIKYWQSGSDPYIFYAENATAAYNIVANRLMRE